MELYCAEMLKDKYGGMVEVRALCNLLRVHIVVFQSTGQHEDFSPELFSGATPVVRLSFHHYLWKGPHFNLLRGPLPVFVDE